MASYYEKYFEDNKIALACGDVDETAIKNMKLEYHERLGSCELGVGKRWNRQFVKEMINKIKKQTNTHSAVCPIQPLNYYVVENENGHDFLLRTSYITPSVRKKVIPWEDSFEVIWELHKNSHANVEGMIELMHINNLCLIKPTADVLCGICYVCRTKNKPNVLTSLYLLDIKEMLPRYDSTNYKHILVYDDLKTRFIHLIPVSVDVVNDSECIELSLELFKIFMDFGPPLYIEVYERLPFFRAVLNSVENAMGVPNKIDLRLKEQTQQRVRVKHVCSEVKEWLLHNRFGDSVGMCYALQWKLNNTIFRGEDKTPYEIVFGGQNQRCLPNPSSSNQGECSTKNNNLKNTTQLYEEVEEVILPNNNSNFYLDDEYEEVIVLA